MLAHHPTAPEDPTPAHHAPPRAAETRDALAPVRPDQTGHPDAGNSCGRIGSGAAAAVRHAVEQRLHWAAEAAALTVLVGALAPWEVIQVHAQSGVVPLTAIAGLCTGWKILAAVPAGIRWLREHHPVQVEVRLSIGRRQQN